MKRGFTLIELLVVVLIIGILAAIALPQYQKAVERSRMAEAVQALDDWANAQSIHFMQSGVFPREWGEALGDITMADPSAAGKWVFSQSGHQNEYTTMEARRDGGMYNGAVLQLTVNNDGSIEKECIPNGHDAFCAMAENAGYEKVESNEGGNSGGTVRVRCGACWCDEHGNVVGDCMSV